MQEFVEIGRGREARRTYDLADINIVPSRRTRTSKDVSTAWQLDAYRLDIPVMSHPTDALGSPAFIGELGRLGGLGVFNAEGLYARHRDAAEKIATLGERARRTPTRAQRRDLTHLLQSWHYAPIDEDLIVQAIGEIRETGATVAVRVSPQNARTLAPLVIKAGVEILVVQGTLISAEHVSSEGKEPLNLKSFITQLDVPVVVGGVIDYRTALHVMRTGAAGVIVGYGSKQGTTTSGETLGINVHMASAIADAAAARRDYLDETGGRYVHVVADGDIATSGDIARAVACGADAVVLGEPLAGAAEAPAGGAYWPSAAGHPSLPRGAVVDTDGAAEADATGERDSLATIIAGPSDDPFGEINLVGGLRRSMAKCGYTDLKEFQKVALSVR